MSFNRENIIWQSPDGTWNRGFFAVSWVDPSPDADPEWDVEYDYDDFEWLATGLGSEDAAWKSWKGANPGGYNLADQPQQVDRLEKIKARVLQRRTAR